MRANFWNCIILRRERAEEPSTVTGATVHFIGEGPESIDCCEERADVLPWIPALMARDDSAYDKSLRAPLSLMAIAERCKAVIRRAESAGLTIDNGNVVDLLADNICNASLSDLRAALVVCGAGYGDRFAKAISYKSPSTYGEQDAEFGRAMDRGLLRGQTYRPA